MKPILILIKDLKGHKAFFAFIFLVGALSSALKASSAGLVKTMGSFIFDSPEESLIGAASDSMSVVVTNWAHAFGIPPLIFTALLLSVAFIMANVFSYVFMYHMRSLAETKAVETREKLMKHYLSLEARSKSDFSEGSGSLISRILNDVNLYQEGIRKVADLIKEPLLVIFATLWLFFLNWKVVTFLFLGLPPIFFIIKSLSKSLRKHSLRSQETMEGLTMTLKEGLDGARVIHSYNLEKKILTRFKNHTQRYLKIIKTIISREEMSGPITESISSVVFCASFLLIAYLVKTEGLTFSDFFGISVAIGFLTDSARKSQTAYIRIQQAAVAKERIDKILNRTTKFQMEQGVEPFPAHFKKLSVKNLTVSMESKNILDQISLELPAQKTVALVGPSGSGKSTFLNCLDLYLKPTQGQIYFDDIEIREIQDAGLKNNIALVSQDPFLFNTTVFENFKLIKPDITEDKVAQALKLANADFILALPEGVHTEVGERGQRFSGGERQRLSIARALIKDSPILLLDEATSALDTQSEIEVQKGLDSLKRGRTCFVVAHRLSTIRDADIILVFEKGKIIESGTHEELLSQAGLYADLIEKST